jgi:hypothetical protein
VIASVSTIACELGGELAGLDINPLICGPAGVVAVDVLAVPACPEPASAHQRCTAASSAE